MARIRTIKPEFWTDSKTANGAKPYWIYCIVENGSEEIGPCKIGIANNLGKRLSSLQSGNWRPLVLIWKIRVSDRDWAKNVEQYCLGCHRPSVYTPDYRKRLKSEWVETSPYKCLETAMRLLSAKDDNHVRRVA